MPRVISGNKVSLHRQVAHLIKQRVRTGVYRPGGALPSVRAMCDEFDVSVNVVYRAIHELEEHGIVTTHHGKGIMVADREECDRAAIIFGFIHPYASSMGFHRSVLEYVDAAFSERSNFAVVRSSRDDPELERRIAEHLIANGVRGLILWPTNDDPNGEYFMRLAKTIPVVLVDRDLPGTDLPTVVLDYFTCGFEVAQTFLGEMGRRRVLVLMDDLRISSYQEIANGIERGAAECGRAKDVTIVRLPITQQLIQRINQSDFNDIDQFVERVERLLRDGEYDAVFCTQDEFIDYVLVQTGLVDRYPKLLMATLRGYHPNERSMKYCRLNRLEWISNAGQMVSQAADLVQRWVLSREMPRETARLKMELAERQTK